VDCECHDTTVSEQDRGKPTLLTHSTWGRTTAMTSADRIERARYPCLCRKGEFAVYDCESGHAYPSSWDKLEFEGKFNCPECAQKYSVPKGGREIDCASSAFQTSLMWPGGPKSLDD